MKEIATLLMNLHTFLNVSRAVLIVTSCFHLLLRLFKGVIKENLQKFWIFINLFSILFSDWIWIWYIFR